MNFLDFKQVLAFSLTTCKGATAEDRLFFSAWIPAAMRDIGPSKDWYKVDVLYPKDFSFKKPDDLVSTCMIALYDSSDQQIKYNYNPGSKRIVPNRFLINTSESTQEITGRIDLSEDSHYFHMGSNGADVSYAMIRYLAMPVDSDGFPMIPEDHLMAYEAYCKYMWSRRENDNQSAIAQNYDIWLRERDRIKGRNKMPSMLEAEGIFSRYLSLIHAPIPASF